jgi:MFS family permease
LSRPGALVAGCAGGFAVSWNIANTGALATTLADHYGVATGVIGLFAAATFLAELVEMLPAGRAIDRFGAKRSMLVAVVLTIVGNLAAMAGGGIVLALWWRFVTGLGVGLGFIAGSIYIRSDAHGHTTARQGIYGGASLSGGGLALGIVRRLRLAGALHHRRLHRLGGPAGGRARTTDGARPPPAGRLLTRAAP